MGVLGAVQSGFLRVHQAIYELSRGAVGHRMLGVPTLLMTSTGRRSGQPRTAALVYAMDDGAWVVTASNGGRDQSPGWLHNVQANPEVDVQIGRAHPFAATAEVIGPDHPDYARLWALVNAKNRDRYNAYQRQTSRPIPLVRLRRR